MTDTNTTAHWITEYIEQMMSGKDVVIVTTGPVKAKAIMRRIEKALGDHMCCIREHTGEVLMQSGAGSIKFAHINSTHLEHISLAASVRLDADISAGNFMAPKAKLFQVDD